MPPLLVFLTGTRGGLDAWTPAGGVQIDCSIIQSCYLVNGFVRSPCFTKPLLGSLQVTANINIRCADSSFGVSEVTLLVIVRAALFEATIMICSTRLKGRTCEPPSVLVCPHILWQ